MKTIHGLEPIVCGIQGSDNGLHLRSIWVPLRGHGRGPYGGAFKLDWGPMVTCGQRCLWA